MRHTDENIDQHADREPHINRYTDVHGIDHTDEYADRNEHQYVVANRHVHAISKFDINADHDVECDQHRDGEQYTHVDGQRYADRNVNPESECVAFGNVDDHTNVDGDTDGNYQSGRGADGNCNIDEHTE